MGPQVIYIFAGRNKPVRRPWQALGWTFPASSITILRVCPIAVVHGRDAVKLPRLSVNSVLAAVAVIAIDCKVTRSIHSRSCPHLNRTGGQWNLA